MSSAARAKASKTESSISPWRWISIRDMGTSFRSIGSCSRRLLLDRARALDAKILRGHVAVHVVIEIDHVGLGRAGQNGRVGGADDAEAALVHQFLQHLQNAALIGDRKG